MKKLIGRKRQVGELQEAIESDAPEMVALIGRRRIGKTFLVRKVYEGRIVFELTGIQHGVKEEQLLNFTLSMRRFFPKFKVEGVPTNWIIAFDQLGSAIDQLDPKRKVVVFLDELPWLGTQRSGFIKGLGYFWNSWASKKNIVVVVCGSAASWVIDKVINDKGGLHNRVTRMLNLPPFSLAETEAFCQSRGIRLSRYQILQLHLTIGGVPMYLDRLKQGLSAIQNIQELCFSETGYLREEFHRIFSSLFNNYERHVAVVRALAAKRKGLDRQSIVEQLKLLDGGNITTVLKELEQSGFITIYGSFGKKKRDRLYRLTDAYTLFYLTYIEPLEPKRELRFTELSDLPQWSIWCGYTFENVCLLHTKQIRDALSISGMSTITSSFYARGTSDVPGAQIDLVIDRGDQSVNLCEIKFSVNELKIPDAMVRNFEQKKQAFYHHTGTHKHLFITLISTYGVKKSYRGLVDQIITMDDLFIHP